MSNHKVWEVDFDVVGPISLVSDIEFRQEKGFDQHQFYSDIRLRRSSYGIQATITAYAENIDIAETVAYVYFGRMRDVLSLENDIPILLYKHEGSYINQRKFKSRRLLDKPDIITAFKMARKFEREQPKLLRAVGWYSKGKISQNTLDKFLAFWNVIEILGKEYHVQTERTLGENKTKNKIYQCFVDYFGDINEWDLPEKWIDDMYVKRNELVHGGEDTTIEAINNVSILISTLEQTSNKLIISIIDTLYDRRDFIYFDF